MALVAAAETQSCVDRFQQRIQSIEYTALKRLAEGEARERKNGISLWLAALNPAVLAMVQRSPLGETLGRERMFFNLEQAVTKYQAQ